MNRPWITIGTTFVTICANGTNSNYLLPQFHYRRQRQSILQNFVISVRKISRQCPQWLRGIKIFRITKKPLVTAKFLFKLNGWPLFILIVNFMSRKNISIGDEGETDCVSYQE
jgi:hypothetical protein